MIKLIISFLWKCFGVKLPSMQALNAMILIELRSVRGMRRLNYICHGIKLEIPKGDNYRK